MFAIGLSILLSLMQAPQTGTLVGVVTAPGAANPVTAARVVLLPPTYTEIWSKQVQMRIDNYWEMFKPEFAVNKEHFVEFDRMAQIEALRFVAAAMRNELGVGAANLIKQSSGGGQFEFTGVPFGTYQLLVQATVSGKEVLWSKTVYIQTGIPTFVDLGKPVS